MKKVSPGPRVMARTSDLTQSFVFLPITRLAGLTDHKKMIITIQVFPMEENIGGLVGMIF